MRARVVVEDDQVWRGTQLGVESERVDEWDLAPQPIRGFLRGPQGDMSAAKAVPAVSAGSASFGGIIRPHLGLGPEYSDFRLALCDVATLENPNTALGARVCETQIVE